MTTPTHFVTGLLIGQFLGFPLESALAAVLVDLDHLVPYAKKGFLLKPKKLWSVLTDREDPWGDQRNVFHNVCVCAFIGLLLILSPWQVGLAVALGYASHLLLDALDSSVYYPFYPSRKLKIKGIVNYLSWSEFVFFVFLLLMNLWFFTTPNLL